MSSAIQVETFEVSEQTTGVTDAFDNEAVELIERLGLEGQRSLLRQRETGDGAVTVRCPYRRMTAEEARVYGVICPTHTRLADYRSSAIPLRILQVAAHAVEFFDYIEVWHPKERVDDDPVLVGVTSQKTQHGWREEERFILARWGTELLPLGELRDRAVNSLRREWEAKARGAIADAEQFLAKIDSNIERHLNGDYVVVPA